MSVEELENMDRVLMFLLLLKWSHQEHVLDIMLMSRLLYPGRNYLLQEEFRLKSNPLMMYGCSTWHARTWECCNIRHYCWCRGLFWFYRWTKTWACTLYSIRIENYAILKSLLKELEEFDPEEPKLLKISQLWFLNIAENTWNTKPWTIVNYSDRVWSDWWLVVG